MKAWRGAVTMVAVLAVSSAWAATDDKAKPRSGGGGGSSSSAGNRHHSGSDSGSKGSGSHKSSSSSSSASDSSSSAHTPTPAQLRHPRAGTGTGFRDRRFRSGRYGYYGYGYAPYWYGFYGYSWYSPFYYGGGGYYGGYQPYAQHRYGYSSYRAGSVRVLVEPNETRVYVDGYYAGIADDFDGIFQRLNLAPGRHDISLKLEGHRTHNVKLYVPYDGTIKLHHRMTRGTGEEDAGVVGRPEDHARYEERGDPEDGRDEEYEDDRDDRDLRSDQAGERALVRLDVRPGDASVYVDGAFRGTGRELRQLRLTAGRHRIEVVRPGYRTVERDVDVRGGQTLDVDIDLDRS